MPRRHRRNDAPRPLSGAAAGEREEHADGTWEVRRLTGVTVVKSYRCPGCQQLIAVGTPHVLVWPAGTEGEDRRHWHTGCWASRDRRRPTGGRTLR
ncbi:MAG: hypothetical protein ACT4QF_05920 [Sporichthyaceae bacterium]